MKLFHDFGDTDSFKLVPAVRHPTGSCVDESNCDYEKVTACAFDGATAKKQVDFLACMDEQRGAALDAAKTCASKSGKSYSTIESCFKSDHALKLLEEASKTFNSYCPGRTTIPHTFVNKDDVQPSYGALKTALCKDGSSAAVCSSITTASSAPCIV